MERDWLKIALACGAALSAVANGGQFIVRGQGEARVGEQCAAVVENMAAAQVATTLKSERRACRLRHVRDWARARGWAEPTSAEWDALCSPADSAGASVEPGDFCSEDDHIKGEGCDG